MKVAETLSERERTHGSFEDYAFVARALKGIVRDHQLPDEQAEALEMICAKIARILTGNSNFADHWHDIAGYATLAERSCGDT